MGGNNFHYYYNKGKSISKIAQRLKFPKYALLLTVLLAAFGIRLLYLFVVVGPNSFPSDFDSVEHHRIAQNLVQGNGYSMYGHPTAYRAPGLTYFMAAVYSIFGESFAAVRVGIILLSLMVIYSIYYLGKLLFHPNVGLWAALIAAVYPHLIFYSARIFTEIPFILFSLVSVIFFVHFTQKRKFYHLILTSIFLALTILTRPIGFILLGFLLLYLLVKLPRWKNINSTVWLLGLTLLVISPWIIRNYQTFHRFVPVTTQGGIVLWVGNNHYIAHHPYWWGLHALYQRLPGAAKLITQDEITRSDEALKLAINFFQKYPQDIPRLIWNKARRFWDYQFFTASPRRWVYEYSYIGLLIIAIGGVVLSVRIRNSNLIFLWILILVNFIPALIFWAGARFRLPVEPVLMIFGGLFIEQLRNWIWSD